MYSSQRCTLKDKPLHQVETERWCYLQSYDGHQQLKSIRVLIVSDYAYLAGGIEQFVCQLIADVSSWAECRLLSWSSEILMPPGFPGLYPVECGDIRESWSLMDWATVLLVPTSFNVRILARLVTEYARRNPKPIVTVVHTSSHSDPGASSTQLQEEWLAELASRSTWIVAVAEEVADAVRSLPLMDDSVKRIVVIENAARLSAVRSVQRGENRHVVSFVGRPFLQKGFDLYARLARDLSGTGLKFMANTVGVPIPEPIEDITVSTMLSDDELLSFFEQTDVLVAPYVYADGLPLALLEALNCGVPVIGFDSPGVGRLLRKYAQKVVAPNYVELRRAVEDWHSGRLHLTRPHPGSVPTWGDALAKYASIIRSIGA